MGRNTKVDLDELLPEFGVTRRELEADVKRRIQSLDAGESVSSDELRAELRRNQILRKEKKNQLLSR